MIPALALGVVLSHAHVLTMSAGEPAASTVAVAVAAGGRIAYVGDDLEKARAAAGPGATVLDLHGETLLPGFNDAHAHFSLSLTLGSARGVPIPDLPRAQFIRALKRASAAHPWPPASLGWLFILTPELPRGIARARDLRFIKRPLFVITEHGGLFNRRGLAAAALPRGAAPQGFVRGRLLPITLDRIAHRLPAHVLEAGAHAFLALLARSGITSVQLIDELPRLFERLRQRGQLTARVRFIPFGYRFDTHLYASSWKGPAPAWVRVEGVKYFHDGWAPIPRYELSELLGFHGAARRQIVIHVLSRHALDSLLDMIDLEAPKVPGLGKLVRIEHADEVTAAQAARLARLGITVCSNPSMIPEWHQTWAFPMHTLLAAGVPLCIGSDYVGRHDPPRPIAPLFAIAQAAGRPGPERISVREALRAFTLGSAAAEGEAATKGSIAVGKWADMTALSADPTTTPPDRIADIQVMLTMVGGRIVYRRAAAAPPSAARAGVTPRANELTLPQWKRSVGHE